MVADSIHGKTEQFGLILLFDARLNSNKRASEVRTLEPRHLRRGESVGYSLSICSGNDATYH